MKLRMNSSRLIAVALIAGATVWIGSGVIGKSAPAPKETKADGAPVRFKVSVAPAKVEPHAPSLTLSGRTEADKRANAMTRTAGVIIDLKVRRGTVVKAGQTIAILSDEARGAQVEQAKARYDQREVELKARLRLIEEGAYPAINKPALEAELRAAQAAVEAAKAEAAKGSVQAPISGVVNTVPVQTGQALQVGVNVAEIVALDPMLAVVEVTERQLGGLRVGDKAEVATVAGQKAVGTVRFISPSASPQTRTYRVDVELPNQEGAIPDGITCTVALKLQPAPAARLPRSALTFSAEGKLVVRIVGADDKVAAVPVTIAEDALDEVWLAGIPDNARVIVLGQDFVKEGEQVEAVTVPAI